jgi:hypothetical protein
MDMAINCAGVEGISTLMQAQLLAIQDVICFMPIRSSAMIADSFTKVSTRACLSNRLVNQHPTLCESITHDLPKGRIARIALSNSATTRQVNARNARGSI